VTVDRTDPDVYRPAEDSELLASVAVERTDPDDRVLDVGCGSGYVAERVAATGASVVGCDLNPAACRETRERGLGVVRCDLVSAFSEEHFDRVVCNPPYLPDHPETPDDWMGVALSGGEDGRAVVERLVDGVGRVLRPDGEALVLVSSLSGVDETAAYAADRGFDTAVRAEESFPFETLAVLRLA
jgi:release factor glutamine methyltransferase